MKKILVSLLMFSVMLFLAGCEDEGVKVELGYNYGTEDAQTFYAEFYYPEEAGIVATLEPDYAELYDEAEEYTLEVALYEEPKDEYEYSKTWAKEEVPDSYKEIEIQGYKGYSYNTLGGFSMFLQLEEIPSEETVRYVSFELETTYGFEEAEKFFNDNKEIKKIVDSFKYLGVIEEKE